MGTLNGTAGHVYFVAQNGLLYFRNANGALVEFGQMTPVTQSSLNTQPLLQQQNTLLQTQPTTTTRQSAETQQPLTQQQQLELQQLQQRVQTRAQATGGNGVPVPGAATTENTAANTGITVPNPGTGPITITGTVLSTDGKTFYAGANGFLYFRGQDGALHVFGSGAPE